MLSRSRWPEVQRERDGRNDFRGNRYTEWGKEREPSIAAWLTAFVDSRLVHNDDPQDLYIHEDGVSAATPDMVADEGPDGLLLAEIKTVKETREWVMPRSQEEAKRIIPLQYWYQVQWQLYVTESFRCIFAWETYRDTGAGFEPVGDPEFFVIERDEEDIQEMVERVDEFLGGAWRSEERPLRIDHILQKLHEVRVLLKPLKEDEQELLDELRECLGDQDATFEGAGLRVSYTMPRPRRTWQKKEFEAAHPELVEQFTREVPAGQRSLRVTEVKPND